MATLGRVVNSGRTFPLTSIAGAVCVRLWTWLVAVCLSIIVDGADLGTSSPLGVSLLALQPSVLRFPKARVCMPAVALIDVTNTLSDRLHLLRITSPHSEITAKFQPQFLSPHGHTTIQVIFVPRDVGTLDSSLTFTVKHGDVEYDTLYRVHASAQPNQYRLMPVVGSSVISGLPTIHSVVVYNPHEEVLNVRDVFTRDAFLNISLPGVDDLYLMEGGQETDSSDFDAWSVPPKHQKEIVKLSFSAGEPGTYTGLVHVQTDADNLVVPVELDVQEGGVYVLPRAVDFGLLTTPDDSVRVPVTVHNAGPMVVEVLDVSPSVPDAMMSVETGRGLVIPPGGEEKVVLWYRGGMVGRAAGRVVVMTKQSTAVEVEYTANVVRGGLQYRRSELQVAVGGANARRVSAPVELEDGRASQQISGQQPLSREVQLTNTYPVPLALQSMAVEGCEGVVRVCSVAAGAVAGPHATWPPVVVEVAQHAALQQKLPHVCALVVSTNATRHTLPLHIYDGRLQARAVHAELSEEDGTLLSVTRLTALSDRVIFTEDASPTSQRVTMDVGVVGLKQTRTVYVALHNPNPVPVSIKGVQFSASPRLLGVSGISLVHELLAESLDIEGEGRPSVDVQQGEGDLAVCPSSPRPLEPGVDVSWDGGWGLSRRGGGLEGNEQVARAGVERRWTKKRRPPRKGEGESEVGGRGWVRQVQVPKLLRPEAIVAAPSDADKVGVDHAPSYARQDAMALAEGMGEAVRASGRSGGSSHEAPRLSVHASTDADSGQVNVVRLDGSATAAWTIGPQQAAILNLTIVAPATTSSDTLRLRVEGLSFTTAVETLDVALTVCVAKGEVTLEAGPIVGAAGWQGDLTIDASNSMLEPASLRQLYISEPSGFFSAVLERTDLPAGAKDVRIGHLTWELNRLCPILGSKNGQSAVWQCLGEWLTRGGRDGVGHAAQQVGGEGWSKEYVEVGDAEAYRMVRAAWEQVVREKGNEVRGAVYVETDVATVGRLDVSVHVEVPMVAVQADTSAAPKLRVHQAHAGFVEVLNPFADAPLDVRLLIGEEDADAVAIEADMGSTATRMWTGMSRERLTPEVTDDEEGVIWRELPSESFGDGGEDDLDTFAFDPRALSLVTVGPGGRALLGPLLFQPPSVGKYSLSLYVWNNATGLEAVEVNAQVGQSSLSVQDDQGLLLAATDTPSQTKVVMRFDVEAAADRGGGVLAGAARSVVLRNDGDLSIDVLEIAIDGEPCGGWKSGFKVVQCPPAKKWSTLKPLYALKPYSVIELDVQYVSPCAATQEAHMLRVVTSAGEATATLVAHASTELLTWCQAVRGEGSFGRVWEGIRIVVAAMAGLAIVCNMIDLVRRLLKRYKHLWPTRPTVEQCKSPQESTASNGCWPIVFGPSEPREPDIALPQAPGQLIPNGTHGVSSGSAPPFVPITQKVVSASSTVSLSDSDSLASHATSTATPPTTAERRRKGKRTGGSEGTKQNDSSAVELNAVASVSADDGDQDAVQIAGAVDPPAAGVGACNNASGDGGKGKKRGSGRRSRRSAMQNGAATPSTASESPPAVEKVPPSPLNTVSPSPPPTPPNGTGPGGPTPYPAHYHRRAFDRVAQPYNSPSPRYLHQQQRAAYRGTSPRRYLRNDLAPRSPMLSLKSTSVTPSPASTAGVPAASSPGFSAGYHGPVRQALFPLSPTISVPAGSSYADVLQQQQQQRQQQQRTLPSPQAWTPPTPKPLFCPQPSRQNGQHPLAHSHSPHAPAGTTRASSSSSSTPSPVLRCVHPATLTLSPCLNAWPGPQSNMSDLILGSPGLQDMEPLRFEDAQSTANELTDVSHDETAAAMAMVAALVDDDGVNADRTATTATTTPLHARPLRVNGHLRPLDAPSVSAGGSSSIAARVGRPPTLMTSSSWDVGVQPPGHLRQSGRQLSAGVISHPFSSATTDGLLSPIPSPTFLPGLCSYAPAASSCAVSPSFSMTDAANIPTTSDSLFSTHSPFASAGPSISLFSSPSFFPHQARSSSENTTATTSTAIRGSTLNPNSPSFLPSALKSASLCHPHISAAAAQRRISRPPPGLERELPERCADLCGGSDPAGDRQE